MTDRLPDWCAFGDSPHRAQYAVDAPRREALTCTAHLPKARRWAGAGHTVTPLGDNLPPAEQQTLF